MTPLSPRARRLVDACDVLFPERPVKTGKKYSVSIPEPVGCVLAPSDDARFAARAVPVFAVGTSVTWDSRA